MIKQFLMRATSTVLIAALGVFVLLPNACYCSTCECAVISLTEENHCCPPAATSCDCCQKSESPSDVPEVPTCQCQPLNDPFIVPSANLLQEQAQASFLPAPTIELDQRPVDICSGGVFSPLILRSDQPLFIAYCRWLI